MEGLCYISILIGIIAALFIVMLCLIAACMRSSQISKETGQFDD